MIKELMHDPIFLAGKSDVATKDDMDTAQDLLDTLIEHREGCVGMAANMIGVKKRIIAFLDESGNQIGESYVGSRSYEQWKEIVDTVLSTVE